MHGAFSKLLSGLGVSVPAYAIEDNHLTRTEVNAADSRLLAAGRVVKDQLGEAAGRTGERGAAPTADGPMTEASRMFQMLCWKWPGNSSCRPPCWKHHHLRDWVVSCEVQIPPGRGTQSLETGGP